MSAASLGKFAVRTFAASLIVAFAGHAGANSYFVQKQFTLKPGGNQPPTVTSLQFCHAWVQDTERDGTYYSDDISQPDSPAQGPGWRDFATERMAGPSGGETNVVQGNSVPPFAVKMHSTPMGGGGAEGFVAEVVTCPSYAKAASEVSVNPPIPANNDVTGTITVDGTNFLKRDFRLRKAYAYSVAWVEAQGSDLINGRIKLRKKVRSFVRGIVPHGHNNMKRDPVNFRVRDLVTGQVTTGRLFAYTLEDLPGPGGDFIWESNQVQITKRDLRFTIDMPGKYSSQAGQALLQVSNGVVTVSSASGIYYGALPVVGSRVPLNFTLSSDVEFDYDLSGITTNAADVNIAMSCAGEAPDEYSGEPPALDLDVVDGTAMVSWPATEVTWQLQSRPALSGALVSPWSDVPVRPALIDGRYVVSAKAIAPQRYFRLRRIDPLPCELTITQPQDVIAPDGGTATFVVEAWALEGPFTYQWQQATGETLFADIPDATSAFYTRRVTLPDNGSQFRCIVSNGCNTLTSAPATLTVIGIAND